MDGIVASSHQRPYPCRTGFSLGFSVHQRGAQSISPIDAGQKTDVQTYYPPHPGPATQSPSGSPGCVIALTQLPQLLRYADLQPALHRLVKAGRLQSLAHDADGMQGIRRPVIGSIQLHF